MQWECQTYRLYMSETMSISASAAAIFCSDESWGRPPKRKDMFICVVLVLGSRLYRLYGDGENTRDEWVEMWCCYCCGLMLDLSDDVARFKKLGELGTWRATCTMLFVTCARGD